MKTVTNIGIVTSICFIITSAILASVISSSLSAKETIFVLLAFFLITLSAFIAALPFSIFITSILYKSKV